MFGLIALILIYLWTVYAWDKLIKELESSDPALICLFFKISTLELEEFFNTLNVIKLMPIFNTISLIVVLTKIK